MDPNREKKILCEMHSKGLITEKELIERLKQSEKCKEASMQEFIDAMKKRIEPTPKQEYINDKKMRKFAPIFTKSI